FRRVVGPAKSMLALRPRRDGVAGQPEDRVLSCLDQPVKPLPCLPNAGSQKRMRESVAVLPCRWLEPIPGFGSESPTAKYVQRALLLLAARRRLRPGIGLIRNSFRRSM